MNIISPAIETRLTAPPVAPAPATTGRGKWPIFGIVAGITGFASALAAISDVTEEQSASGIDVLDQLERGTYFVSFMLGLVSVAAMFVTAAGWKRWADRRAPQDLAARTIGAGLTAVATINIIFACLAGSMALYLPGGMDEGFLARESIFVNYTLLDFGQLLGWWGAAVAAGCVAVLALRRQRLLPRWMGVASIVLMAPAIAFAIAGSLPGFVGLMMPIWLVTISIGLLFSKTAGA